MHGKPITKTKFQIAVDYLRNNTHLLTCEASEFPTMLASKTTWQRALTYVRSNPQLHCKPRSASRYFSREKLTKGKIVGVVTNWDKLNMAVRAYELAGFYADDKQEQSA